ncbi:hypothetical protein I4U23_019767 [Adineta vaga]|nr:hypothetical protein I4U23_019767 [Adineta vaga]
MFVSTFETLPDEIILIIFKYVNEIYFLFHTFLGLNQRLNSILLDKHLHLLPKFLNIKKHDKNFHRYSNSVLFERITQQLLPVNQTTKNSTLKQCFQSLIQFHLQEQYFQMKSKVKEKLSYYKSIRLYLSHEDMLLNDLELKKTFEKPFEKSILKQIEYLVYIKGASLEYNEHEQAGFYFADDFCELVLSSSNLTSKMLQTLFISNPSLLKYPCYGGGHRFSIYEYLVYLIYRTNFIYEQNYHALIELILFATQCQKYESDDEIWLQKMILIILEILSNQRRIKSNQIILYTTQLEILKIFLDEYRSLVRIKLINVDLTDRFKRILDSLIINNRYDIILLIYHNNHFFQDFFDSSKHIVHMLLENQWRRRLFHQMIDKKPWEKWLINDELIFLLLKKKERQLIEKLIKSSPSSIYQLDKDGNNLLLFTCLKVSGRRYRIVELLIQMGCDSQQQNLHGINFTTALRLQKNRWLLYNLIKRKSVHFDDTTEHMTITLPKQSF